MRQVSSAFDLGGDPLLASKLALAQLALQLGQQATLLAGMDFFRLLMWLALGGLWVMVVQEIFN
jgi:hypothetical protein